MVMNKKYTLFAVGTFIALSAVGTVLFLNNNDTAEQSDLTEAEAIVQNTFNELTKKDTDMVFSTDELKNMNSAYESGDYDKAVSIAKKACPEAGDSKFACYGVYSRALAKLKDFKALETLANELLAMDEVKQDKMLLDGWTLVLDSAQKGIDPADAEPIADPGANI
jgi:hypothetical protein